jgi:hypothetical protein
VNGGSSRAAVVVAFVSVRLNLMPAEQRVKPAVDDEATQLVPVDEDELFPSLITAVGGVVAHFFVEAGRRDNNPEVDVGHSLQQLVDRGAPSLVAPVLDLDSYWDGRDVPDRELRFDVPVVPPVSSWKWIRGDG